MTSPFTAAIMSKGPVPYDDVYLDEYQSSEDDEDTLYATPTKPLMSPRKKSNKSRIKLRHPKPRSPFYFKRKQLIIKFLYFCTTLICISLFVFVLIHVFRDAADQHGLLTASGIYELNQKIDAGKFEPDVASDEPLQPCSDFDVEPIWIKTFPNLQTESAIRLIDINLDGILDAVIGFNTVAFSYFGDEYLACAIYFNGSTPCFGGALAVDGRTGGELWRFYADAEIYGLNCEEDVNKDGVKDCLGGGRAGVFHLIDGATGKGIWQFDNEEAKVSISNLYTAQYIHDVDGDGVPDVLNIHGGDPVRKAGMPVSRVGKLVIFSGRTGKVIRFTEVPDGQESYFSPCIYTRRDGTQVVLFGTGGETHGGSLYAVSIMDVVSGNLEKARIIFHDNIKGVMTPPVFVDLNKDGVVDIVVVPFNGTVMAIDGESYDQIWNFTIESSESYSTPAAGYYNNDDVPDFMITYNYGLGYPLYYYSQTTILDGRNGQPILQPYLKSSGSITSSPITVSFEGYGKDAFVFWGLYCKGHEEDTLQFSFKKDEDGSGKSRTNFCKERFGTDDFSKLLILNHDMKLPGNAIYNSENYFKQEHDNIVNTTVLAMDFLEKNPNVKDAVIQKTLEQMNSHQLNGHSTPGKIKQQLEATTANYPAYEDDSYFEPGDEAEKEDYPAFIDRLLNFLGNEINEKGSINSKDADDDEDLWRSIIEEKKRERSNQKLASSDHQGQGYPPNNYFTRYKLNRQPQGRNHQSGGVTDDIDNYYYYDFPGQGKRHGRAVPDKTFKFTNNQKFVEDKNNRNKRSGVNIRKGNPSNKVNFENDLENDRGHTFSKNWRYRRHAGNHDAEGTQRLVSTGSLAPPLDKTIVQQGDGIDILFGTYWFYPQETHLILPEQQACIDSFVKEERQRMNPSSKFYGMDHDAYINTVEDICMGQEVDRPKLTKESISPLNVYPFNIDGGALTLYRMRLTCKCGKNQKCAKVLPYEKQRWPSYMGMHVDSMFGSA